MSVSQSPASMGDVAMTMLMASPARARLVSRVTGAKWMLTNVETNHANMGRGALMT